MNRFLSLSLSLSLSLFLSSNKNQKRNRRTLNQSVNQSPVSTVLDYHVCPPRVLEKMRVKGELLCAVQTTQNSTISHMHRLYTPPSGKSSDLSSAAGLRDVFDRW